MSNAITQQRELFSLFDEFFQRATGKTAKGFAALDEFSETVSSLKTRASKVEETFKGGCLVFMIYMQVKRVTCLQQQGSVEVARGIGGLLNEHRRSARKLEEK